MQNYSIPTKGGVYEISLPTSLNEITTDYLTRVTNYIQLAPEYSLVAIVYREKLAAILNSIKKGQNINANVVPIYVKGGVTDSKFIKQCKLGNKLVITGSDLSLGIHVNSPLNTISINNIVNVCGSDKNIAMEALKNAEPCFFVEFKIVANNVISAIINNIEKKDIMGEEYVKYVPSETAANNQD